MCTGETNELPSTGEMSGEPSRDAIRTELDRILAHPEFQATEKLRRFLRFVVEETLAGRSYQLKGYTIATKVFERGDDFDAAQDPIVRIQAGRLRRALERYYLVAGSRDPVYIDIPKGRYIPHFSRQVVQRGANGSGTSDSGDVELPSLVGPSVAIAPLVDLTGDPDQLFFTVGLTEELTTELGRFQDIIVVSCRHAPRSAGLPADPIELGKTTGARFVLQGTVRRDTESIKVVMHLSDARSGRRFWSRPYKHSVQANRLIATQEKIARSVVAAIGSEYGIIARRLSGESRKKAPAELSTYEAILRYYSYLSNPSPEAIEGCFAALRQAKEREPDFSPIWSALAGLYCEMYQYDVPGFDRPLETALALNTGSPAIMGAAAYCYVSVGEFERGRDLMDRALTRNPFHPRWFHLVYVLDYFRRRDYDRAFAEFEQHRPAEAFWSPVMFVALLGKLGRADEARVHIGELETLKPDFVPRARELIGRWMKVESVIDELIDGLHRGGLPVEM